MEENNVTSEKSELADPLGRWQPGEVWFRESIPWEQPWGKEELLAEVPNSARGSYGVKVGESTSLDGQQYRAGEIVIVDSRADFERLLPGLGTATDLVFPWYDRLVPAGLVAPHTRRVDGEGYRADVKARFLKSLLLTGGLIAAGVYFPEFRMLALLMATMYGLFPLVEAAMAWFQRVDRLPVEELNRRLVNFEFFRRWLVTRQSRMLKVSVAVLVIVFLGQMLAGLGPSIDMAALVKERVKLEGEWWRLVTTGLMHGSILHILFNGMALYNLGRVMVALVNPSLLSFVFLFTVVTGSLASLYLGPAQPSVGASGGILGCLGFLLVVTGKFRSVLPGFLRASLIQSTIVVSIFGLLGAAFIDNAAHAGGLAGGVVLGMVMAPWMRLAPTTSKPAARILSALSLTVLALGVAKVGWELWEIAGIGG
jgi:membrane associated rhomboid family serine protease